MTPTNLTETSTWEPGIQQLERDDLWDAGIAGSGIANRQASQLANRTVYLRDEITAINNKINFINNVAGPFVCPDGTVLNLNGSPYTLPYPLASPDYVTPNDGITRNYEITITCFADFTYLSTANIQMYAYTTSSIPAFEPLVLAVLRSPFQTLSYTKAMSLPPNTAIKVAFGNNATGANATFTDFQLHIKEV